MPNIELKPCPFCGGKNITILSKRTNVWRNAFGDRFEYRIYSARCIRCHSRGASVGGRCSHAERIVKIYGGETHVQSYKYYHDKAAEAWNRRAQDEEP